MSAVFGLYIYISVTTYSLRIIVSVVCTACLWTTLCVLLRTCTRTLWC